VRVRKAFAYSISRELITQNITKGGEPVAYTLTPPDPHYKSLYSISPNLDEAKKLLAEAGYPDGKGFPKLKLIYNTLEEHQKIAVAIQQMWKKNLGIDIELQNQEWKVFIANQHQMNYEISRASWIGDYVDPNTFLEIFISNSGNNETGWSNKQYDDLIRAASLATSSSERIGLLQQAEKILLTELPIMPIYYYSWNRLVSPSVKNWDNNIQDYFSFKNVYLETTK
jgi:oligopeptide transport system substrate-binding protein